MNIDDIRPPWERRQTAQHHRLVWIERIDLNAEPPWPQWHRVVFTPELARDYRLITGREVPKDSLLAEFLALAANRPVLLLQLLGTVEKLFKHCHGQIIQYLSVPDGEASHKEIALAQPNAKDYQDVLAALQRWNIDAALRVPGQLREALTLVPPEMIPFKAP